MSSVHFYALPVVVGAIVMWVIGAIWYGVVFKKRWVALAFDGGEMKPGRPAFEMIASFVLGLVLCFVLTNMIVTFSDIFMKGHPTVRIGYSLGIIYWLGFIAPPMLTQSLFERRPARLFAINACYWIVAMAFAGGIAAALLK